MHSIVKHLNIKLISVLCALIMVGCTPTLIDSKLYLENIEIEILEERTFQIDNAFKYNQIIFRLYYTDDSMDEWQLVESYKFINNGFNTFTTGYNHWNSNNDLFCDSQLYLIYEDNEYKHTAKELENYEKTEGYFSCGGYFLTKKELSYDEVPFYIKK